MSPSVRPNIYIEDRQSAVVATAPRSESLPESLGELGEARLTALCEALRLTDSQQESALAVFRLVSEPWASLPVGDPAWQNDLTDAGVPFEFSTGFEGGRVELRMLFESQTRAGALTQHDSWQAGIELQENLRSRGLCDTARFEQVVDLFTPKPEDAPRFALWHAVVLRENEPSLLKVYLNPEVHGAEHARETVRVALERLGMAAAWDFVNSRLRPETRLAYVSLDLEAGSSARFKVYLTATNADEVESLTRGSANDPEGDVRDWLTKLVGGGGPYEARPVFVCYSFAGSSLLPVSTVHVPVRSYVPSDEVAVQRAFGFLQPQNAGQLRRAVESLAASSLKSSRGILTYVSLRRAGNEVRVTTYLAPKA